MVTSVERPAEIEPAHIGFHEANPGLDVLRLIAQPLTTHREHVRRQVEADDVDSTARDWDQDTTCAAPDFEDRASGFRRRFNEE